MRLSELKNQLQNIDELGFRLPNGAFVPPHFHITEIGLVTKTFIDCGDVVRKEKIISIQLWHSYDLDHRLTPKKVLDILSKSEDQLKLRDFPIEIEYQGDTIGKYGLDFYGRHFYLTARQTTCLASDNCGIPRKKKLSLSEIGQMNDGGCQPGSGCC